MIELRQEDEIPLLNKDPLPYITGSDNSHGSSRVLPSVLMGVLHRSGVGVRPVAVWNTGSKLLVI